MQKAEGEEVLRCNLEVKSSILGKWEQAMARFQRHTDQIFLVRPRKTIRFSAAEAQLRDQTLYLLSQKKKYTLRYSKHFQHLLKLMKLHRLPSQNLQLSRLVELSNQFSKFMVEDEYGPNSKTRQKLAPSSPMLLAMPISKGSEVLPPPGRPLNFQFGPVVEGDGLEKMVDLNQHFMLGKEWNLYHGGIKLKSRSEENAFSKVLEEVLRQEEGEQRLQLFAQTFLFKEDNRSLLEVVAGALRLGPVFLQKQQKQDEVTKMMRVIQFQLAFTMALFGRGMPRLSDLCETYQAYAGQNPIFLEQVTSSCLAFSLHGQGYIIFGVLEGWLKLKPLQLQCGFNKHIVVGFEDGTRFETNLLRFEYNTPLSQKQHGRLAGRSIVTSNGDLCGLIKAESQITAEVGTLRKNDQRRSGLQLKEDAAFSLGRVLGKMRCRPFQSMQWQGQPAFDFFDDTILIYKLSEEKCPLPSQT